MHRHLPSNFAKRINIFTTMTLYAKKLLIEQDFSQYHNAALCLQQQNESLKTMDRQRGHLEKNPQDAVDNLIWIKVVGIGNAGVGKTCLIKHFCESKFSGGYQPTVGVDYGFKIQNVKGYELRVHLWDLSGSPEYIDVRNELYGQTDAVFLVFDVTDQASFESLDTWLKEVNKYSSGVQDIVLVANKVDTKSGKRLISTQDAKKWATSRKINLYEASAATGDGVHKLFDEMLNNILNKRKQAGLLPKNL